MSGDEYDGFDGTYGPQDDDASNEPIKPWETDEALSNLTMERQVHPSETPEQTTKRLLEEAAPLAAMSIIHIALHDQNSNTRSRAAMYITDRIYNNDGESAQSWEKMLGDVVSEAEILAKNSAGTEK